MDEIIYDEVVIKPVVYFTGKATFDTTRFEGIEVGRVNAVDHYVWGRDVIRTSAVLKKYPDGSFETMNTLYKPLTSNDALNKMAENAKELGLDYDT
jgi:hypothetical protein